MSNKDLLDSIKKLREMTGVGFKDCKLALDESSGNIEQSIEFLRKKGIAKASKKMNRTASEGLALVKEDQGEISIIEINSETDFVAKNEDFISFCKELSDINFKSKGNIDKINESLMVNKITVKDNLNNLIAKIGEKITIRRVNFFDNKNGSNFSYVHSSIEKNLGKIISILKLDGIVKGKNNDIGTKIAMHIAASNPLAIDESGLKKEVVEKEL
jgi:elongation factor Ts